MKIVVLAGGLSPERNVSLSSGALVTEALRARGHQVALIDLFFGLEGVEGAAEGLFVAPISETFKKVDSKAPNLEEIRSQRSWKSDSVIGQGVLELCATADITYLALHGACGEDGKLQATLELMGIPYTGSGSLGSAIAMDKDLTKRLVQHCVPTPQWSSVTVTEENIQQLTETTPLPVVVKPLDSGSSIGVSIAFDRETLQRGLEESVTLGGRTVLEQYIKGREIQVAVLCDRALPSIEIIPKTGFYDYENKYQPGAAEEICPAPISPQLEQQVGDYALAVFRTLGLSVYSRADFILAEDGTLYFLEINTLPGMTPTSLVPQEAAVAGIDYATLCETIIEASLAVRKAGG